MKISDTLITPRGVYNERIRELQAILMDQDCYLPGLKRSMPALIRNALYRASKGDATPLYNGIDRPLGNEDNGWWGEVGESVTVCFEDPAYISQVRLTFDSDLRKKKRMPCQYPKAGFRTQPPAILVRDADLEAQQPDGSWQLVAKLRTNYQRLITLPIAIETRGLRFIVRATWGADSAHIMALDVR